METIVVYLVSTATEKVARQPVIAGKGSGREEPGVFLRGTSTQK